VTTPQYYTLEQLLDMVDEPQRAICQQILADNRELFATARGSKNNHQAWLGGYWDHVVETMNIAVVLYRSLGATKRIRYGCFSLSEALVVMFLHDIEKPWKYSLGDDGKLQENPALADKSARKKFRESKMGKYGLVLNERQQNAMRHVEGELADYSNEQRAMWPLAAFCHSCDVLSARLWPEYPRPNDPWQGAARLSGDSRTWPDVCPTCGSAEQLIMRNFDARCREADLHCQVCGGYVRDWDAG